MKRVSDPVGLFLVLLFFFCGPSLALSQESGGELDDQFIPESAVALLVLHPSHLANSEHLELLPREIVSAWGEKELGMDPLKIKQLIAFVDQPSFDRPPRWGAVLRMEEPVFLKPGGLGLEPTEKLGTTQIYAGHGEPAVAMIDAQTYLVGESDFLPEMIAAKGVDSDLFQMANANIDANRICGYVSVEQLRPFLTQAMDQRGIEVPPPFQPFTELPELIDTLQFEQDLDMEMSSRLTLNAPDQEKAARLEALISQGLEMGSQFVLSQMATEMDMNDPVQQATLKYAHRLAEYFKTQLAPRQEGASLVFEANQGIASAPILVGLLLPAVQQARSAARRTDSMNRMRQMILAMHNYHDAYRKMPTNIYDDDGNALLSWRVQILPFMEELNLYNEFNMEEPWDSPHNAQWIEAMPEMYSSPDLPLPPGKTLYLGVAGKGCIFDGNPVRLQDIMDGTSRTICLVEVNPDAAVTWSQPVDLQVDMNQPMRSLGGIRPAGFLAALCDGSVQMISPDIDPETLSWLFQKNDGNVPNY